MPRKKNHKGTGKDVSKKKEAPDGGTSETSVADMIVDGTDDNTSVDESQANSSGNESVWDGEVVPEYGDGDKGRHFGFLVYPSEDLVKASVPDCEYDGWRGWGTAPDNWKELLEQTGLPFTVSPLHYRDSVIDIATGEYRVKKPHWHVIVSWGNSTTYKSAKALTAITNGPRPFILKHVIGYFLYFNHKKNPEKYQYKELPETFNGWERPIDNNEATQILRELTEVVILRNCQEYAELVIEAVAMGTEYYQVAMGHTLYLARLCDGMRWNPVRVLERYIARTEDLDDETRKELEHHIEEMRKEVPERTRERKNLEHFRR